MKKIIFAITVIFLSGCVNAPQRYGISADNNLALKASGGVNINVGLFTNTADFSNNCRGLYGQLSLPDNMSFEGYIQKGFIDELKVAGIFDDKEAKITLSGVIEKLSFSTLTSLMGGGSWDIGLRINSSNGKSTYVSEHYEFDSSIQVWAACAQTANAYMPAVQNILGKLIKSPDFKSLVTLKDQAGSPSEPQRSKSAIQITAPVATQPVVVVKTNEEKLKELKRLSDAGLISKEVYLEQQKMILSNP